MRPPGPDSQDRAPAAWDAYGAELWPGEAAVVYGGRALALESFQDEALRLALAEPLTLAESMGLEIIRYGRRGIQYE